MYRSVLLGKIKELLLSACELKGSSRRSLADAKLRQQNFETLASAKA